MFLFKVDDNTEYKIKFSYEPTIKGRIISKLVASESAVENAGDDLGNIENVLLVLPEVILAGLQTYHRDEFGYNYDTCEDKDVALNKVFALLDRYFDTEDADFTALYSNIENELMNDGFLRSLFHQEVAKVEQKKTARKSTTAKN